MKKKIVLIFVALFVLYMPFSITHQEVNAVAVASKVVNASAKKVAKEIAKDTAVEMSMNFVMDYKYTPKDNSTPKEGYSFICIPKDRKTDGDCGNPMQVKTVLSADDKTQLAQKVEINLDKKITGGIGASRWGKFLDWFVPISTIGLGVAVVGYAMDGEVSDLFDELAFDSLVENGLIQSSVESPSNSGLNHPLVIKTEVDRPDYGFKEVQYTVTGNATFNFQYDGVQDNRKMTGMGGTILFYNYYDGRVIAYHRQYFEYPVVPSSISVTVDDGPVEVPPIPKWDSLDLSRTNPAGKNINVPSPGSIPYKDLDTGEQLLPYVKPDGTIGFKTRTGVERPEEKVEVGNPTIIENPDGSKTVVKAPTVTTPNPSPSENGTIPKAPPKDETITEEELGNSCARLKKPDFKPLTNAFTTSFPFSIPWDLQRMFESAFAEIGSDEPSFEYKFEFNGKPKTWKIEFPDYFADWTKFVRPLLLIIFDIGLIYAIYRFTKGSD